MFVQKCSEFYSSFMNLKDSPHMNLTGHDLATSSFSIREATLTGTPDLAINVDPHAQAPIKQMPQAVDTK